MKVFQTVERRQTAIKEIMCNMCGRFSKKNELGYFEEFVEVNKKWGYHSEFDGETHSFEMCPDCYKKLIDKFAVQITRE